MLEIWNSMSWIARSVVIILALLSVYSITVMIERLITFAKAKKQSLLFARQVTAYLKQDNIAGAIAESIQARSTIFSGYKEPLTAVLIFRRNAGTIERASTGHVVPRLCSPSATIWPKASAPCAPTNCAPRSPCWG